MARTRPELLALVFLACGGPPTSAPACDDGWEEVEPVFRTWCTSCHSSELEGDLRYGAPPGVDLDTLAGVRRSQAGVRAMLEAGAMPPAGGLEDADRDTLLAWLACDAPGTSVPAPLDCGVPTVVSAPEDASGLCGELALVVEGDLRLQGDLSLPCLCEVHGDLVLAGGWADLPVLERLTGSLRSEVGVTGLSAPRLVEIGRDTSLTSLTDLTEADLATLASVGGDLVLRDLPALEEVRLPLLREVGGSLALEDLPSVRAIDGEGYALRTVGGDLVLSGMPSLGGFYGFGQLQQVAGDVVIEELGGTRLDGFTVLTRIGGSLTIARHPRLVAVDGFDLLEEVGGELVVREAPSLQGHDAFASLRRVGGLRLEVLPAAVSLALPPLESCAGDLVLRRVGVGDLVRPEGLTRIGGSLSVVDDPALEALTGWTALEEVGGDLRITDCPVLPASAAEAVAAAPAVGGTVEVARNGP